MGCDYDGLTSEQVHEIAERHTFEEIKKVVNRRGGLSMYQKCWLIETVETLRAELKNVRLQKDANATLALEHKLSIELLRRTLHKAKRELRALRDAGSLSPKQKEEYAATINAISEALDER